MSDTFLGKNYLNFFTSIFEDKEDKEEKNRLFEQNMQRNLSLLNESNMDNLRTAYTNDPTFNTPNFDPNTITVTSKFGDVKSMRPNVINVTDDIYETKAASGDPMYRIGEGKTLTGTDFKKTTITPENINAVSNFIEQNNRQSKFRGDNTVYTIDNTAGKEGAALVNALKAEPYTPAIAERIKNLTTDTNPITPQAAESIISMFDIQNGGLGVAKPVMGSSFNNMANLMSFLPLVAKGFGSNNTRLAPLPVAVANSGLLSRPREDLYSMFRS